MPKRKFQTNVRTCAICGEPVRGVWIICQRCWDAKFGRGMTFSFYSELKNGRTLRISQPKESSRLN